jgi:hypothetical protein
LGVDCYRVVEVEVKIAHKVRDTALAALALASVYTNRTQAQTQTRLSPVAAVDTNNIDWSTARVTKKDAVRIFSVDVYGDKLAPALQKTMDVVGFRAVPSAERFAATVDRIIADAKGHPISQVNFFGHGLPGMMLASRDEALTSYLLTQPATREALTRLSQQLAPDATIRLYGCLVGRDEVGTDLLVSLSKLTGARVEAGISTQIPDPGELDGLVKVATPTPNGDPHISYRRSKNFIGNLILSSRQKRRPDQLIELRAGNESFTGNVDLAITSGRHSNNMLQFLEKPVDSATQHLDQLLHPGVLAIVAGPQRQEQEGRTHVCGCRADSSRSTQSTNRCVVRPSVW